MSDRRYLWSLLILFAVMLFGPVLLAQTVGAVAAAADVKTSPLQPGQTNETVVAFIWAYAGSALLQTWKRSPLGGLHEWTAPYAKRLIAVAVAIASALGVHSSFDAAAGTLTITGLLLPGIWTAIGDSIRQFVLQQYIWKTAIKQEAS